MRRVRELLVEAPYISRAFSLHSDTMFSLLLE
jgi:hypothetical protein